MDSYNEALLSRVDDPFSHDNGIRLLSLDPDEVTGELLVTPACINPAGVVHGGALCTLADTVGGAAAFLRYGKVCVTQCSTMNYLRGTKEGNHSIVCKATPVKLGHRVAVYRVTLTDDTEKIVATGDFTFFVGQ